MTQKKAEKKGSYKTIIDVKQMLHDTIHDPNQGALLGCDDKLLKPLAQFANRLDFLTFYSICTRF